MPNETPSKLKTFPEVLADEHRVVEELRGRRDHTRFTKSPGDRTQPPIGLAISGGGIRSATFALGVIQVLRAKGLLGWFDYLSTVSGGGYIGSWLVAAIQRDTIEDDDKWARAIHHLRRFSNYLAPRTGALSADTWTIAMVWIRNTMLVQIPLLLAVVLVLLAPWLTHVLYDPAQEWLFEPYSRHAAGALGGLMMLACAYQASVRLQSPRGVPLFHIVGKLVASALLLSVWGWWAVNSATNVPLTELIGGTLTVSLAIVAAASVGDWRKHWNLILWAVIISVGVGLGLSTFLVQLLKDWSWKKYLHSWHALVWTPGLILLIESVVLVMMIGILGRAMPDAKREWWSRLGAWLGIWGVNGLAVSCLAVYGPWAIAWIAEHAPGWVQTASGGAWIATTAAGLIAGRSEKTHGGPTEKNKLLDGLAKAAPHVFMVGLLMGIATLLVRILSGQPFEILAPAMLSALNFMSPETLLLAAMATTAALGIFAWRIDINEFSMNHFYKNRLVRCYLGATNPMRQDTDPDTGFCPSDDFRLSCLLTANYAGPFPIINTALNLGPSSDLDVQERRAASFFFTPRHAGFTLPEKTRRALNLTEGEGERAVGFRPTAHFQNEGESGIHLGTAVAISGAAASPNMGYHTSTAVAFLMTLFNVRLGWWVPHPARNLWREPAPLFSIQYLVRELFGFAGLESNFVYLSDGGHFENLAVYELLRRRCRFILVLDGEQDSAFSFGGLGGLIRKARTDFQCEIDLDPEQIARRNTEGFSEAHCAVGKIHYRDPHEEGYLLYLKLSVTGDEDRDILQYRAANPDFPHQSTGDQFFNESQFESYRRLGQHVAENTFRHFDLNGVIDWPTLRLKLAELHSHFRSSAAGSGDFTRHTTELNRLSADLQADPELAFVAHQIFPEWQHLAKPAHPVDWIPTEESALRKSFFFFQRVIQLMENVYLDLDLETQWEHPDNSGWRNLFNLWCWSGMFRVTWAVMRQTYGKRFQDFCDRALGLSEAVHIRVEKARGGEAEFEGLNFFERKIVAELAQIGAGGGAFEIRRITATVRNPRAEHQKFEYPCGFCIIRDGTLLFSRVQNHLRGRGLHTAALRQLIEEGIRVNDSSEIERRKWREQIEARLGAI